MINNQKTKIICELHPQHRGSMNDIQSMILQCKMFGGDFVKLQLYDTVRLHGDNKRKHLEISFEELKSIKSYCDNLSIELFCSVFDEERVDWCIDLNFKYIKIASRSFENEKLVKKALASYKIVFISNGFNAGDFRYGKNEWDSRLPLYFYCTPEYPTTLNNVVIPDFVDNYCGFSDHSLGLTACKLAIAKGAKFIEKHFTLNKNMHVDYEKGHLGSMDYKELKQLKDFIIEYELINER